MIWGIGVFYATRCGSITVASYATAKILRELKLTSGGPLQPPEVQGP